MKDDLPANIRLDEDGLKTSFLFAFRRRLEDVLIKTNMFALALRLQKTSSRRLQDVLVKTSIFLLAIRLQDVFKMFSRRLQDVLQKRLPDIFKASSRRFEDVSSSLTVLVNTSFGSIQHASETFFSKDDYLQRDMPR